VKLYLVSVVILDLMDALEHTCVWGVNKNTFCFEIMSFILIHTDDFG